MNAARDRDEAGRAHNARPRDALGRPLPRHETGVPRIPDDLDVTPEQGLSAAQRLLDEGLAFNAHEVLEAVWKDAPPEHRELWRGLAQLAVGITHVQRGNRAGARALLMRASAAIAHGPAVHGIDVPGLVAYADALADDLSGDAGIGQERLRPRLSGASGGHG
ncbi:DUF309 domain-containing protein [Mycobacterium sp. CPCC 205372]|uniref:DUF309 domain-containing protein n=1 Tax=Mycobacterium hippophais TaxID=3016340 RepID=A0ABT4PMR1_9MYCO|nr:DUF309 domain-containing protein [Mycobacterium hippophais]MCZ8377854.1 DUF309 domain-containing protein [Mycobacterium hippophais]